MKYSSLFMYSIGAPINNNTPVEGADDPSLVDFTTTQEPSTKGDTDPDEPINTSIESIEDESRRTMLSSIEGAHELDVDGNLLDNSGNVLKSKSGLEEYKKEYDTRLEEQRRIDNGLGDGEDIDEEGNVVDNKGNIIRTPQEQEEYLTQIDNENYLRELQEQIGYVPQVNGVDVEYEATDEGIIKYMNDAIEVAKLEQMQTFLDSNPRIKAYYDHIQLGGLDEDYFNNEIDVSGIVLEDKDENMSQQTLVINAHYKEMGLDANSREVAINALKEQGKLFEQSQRSLQEINKIRNIRDTERKNALQQQQENERKQIEEHWNGIKSVVKKGNLTLSIGGENPININIPARDQDGFMDYISKAVENGVTQSQIDYEKLPLSEKLALEYIRYSGKSLTDLINHQASRKFTGRVRRNSTASKSFGGGNSRTNRSKSGSKDDPSKVSF